MSPPQPVDGRSRSWRHRAALAGGLLFCSLVVGLGASGTVHAATRTWTGLGLTNNWSDAGNWSGSVIPGAADVATFDATSSKNATINAVVNVAGVSVGAGCTGTITQSPGIAVTIGASGFSQAGGTFAGGTAVVTVNGPFTLTGGSFAATSGTLSVSGSFTDSGGAFNAGGGTTSFGGGAATLTVSTPDTFNNVAFAAGTKTVAAGTTLTVTGALSLTAGALNGTGTLAAQGSISQALGYAGGAATLLINGAGAQTFTGAATLAAGSLPNVNIDKPSGTLTLAGTIRTSNSWTYTAGTLDPGTSTVVFAGGTITGSHTLNALDFRATSSIAAGTTLTVTGALSLTAGSLNGTGTLAAQGPISQALGYGGGSGTLLINGAGAQTLTGASTTASGNLPLFVLNKPSGTLTLAGTIRTSNSWTYTAGTLDPGTSTVVFAGTQTITGSQALTDVAFNGGNTTYTVAAGTVLTVAGTLTLTDGNINTGTVAAQGSISQASTFDGNSGTLLINGAGAQTFTGASTLAAGSLPNVNIDKPSGTLSLAGTIRTTHSWTYTAGTLDPGTSTVVFAGGTVTAAGMSFYDVTANGGITTLGAAMVIAHNLTVSAGTFTTSASGYGLTIGGNLTVTGIFRENGSAVVIQGNVTNNGTVVAGTSTVTLNGSAGQSIGGSVAMSSYNLVVVNPAGVSLSANLVVTGTLTLTSGPLAVGGQLLTISNPIAGTLTNLVAGASSSLTVNGAGAGISVPSTVSQLSALTLNNPSGLALEADLTIGGTLTLTAGRLDAGANAVVIGAGGTVVRTGGWVVGRLQKRAVAGSAVGLTFEIGDATRYTPADIAFVTVTTPGELTASTTFGDHADGANSGLAVNRSVNRFWTVTNAGVVFDAYDATFTFVATDIDPGADPTVFIVAKRDGAAWTRPTVGTRTALSTLATGMTLFSDFAVGEPTANLGVTVSDGLSSVTAGDGLAHGYTITVSNSGPSDATGVTLTDTWPTGFSQGTISLSQGSCAPIGGGPDFGCSLGTIAAGGSATVSVAYTVPASTGGGPQTEAVSVTSSVVDPAGADNSAIDTTTVVRSRRTPTPTPTPTATKLMFSAQPGTSTATQPFPTQPAVAITDVGGNVVTTGAPSTNTVTLALGANPSGGALTCAGGLTKAAVAGIATFAGCAISRAGVAYTLVASSSGLTSATSTSFNVLTKATLRVTNSASVITWASQIRITVRIDQSGANRTVQLRRSRDGANWTTIASLTTNAKGIATFLYKPATNLYYRAVFAGAPDLGALSSNTTRTVVRQISILRPTNKGFVRHVRRGTAITFVDTVRPARPELTPATVRFVFYRRATGGAWVLFALRDVPINSFGQASTRWRFTAGEWYVRSQARPTPTNTNSVWGPVERYNVH